MKILITGAQGFIGSHLVRALADEHEIYALSSHLGQSRTGYFCRIPRGNNRQKGGIEL